MAVINPHAQGTVTLGNNTASQWVTAGPTISNLPYQGQTTFNPNNVSHFTVEKVDNGFILRSGRFQGDISKTKVCSSIEEVKDLFVAVLVEYQLDK